VSKHFATVWDAYHFLNDHAVQGSNGTGFLDVLYIFVTKVNPANNTIDDDSSKNTAIRVRLESGPGTEHITDALGYEGDVHIHDPRLDVGGATFEEALIKLAERVRTHYGSTSQYDSEASSQSLDPISPDLQTFLDRLEKSDSTARLEAIDLTAETPSKA
jgi:hypothetical protein